MLAVLGFTSLVYLRTKLSNTKLERCYIIREVRDETSDQYFSYISAYLLSSIGLSWNHIVDVFVLVFLMALAVYIHSP